MSDILIKPEIEEPEADLDEPKFSHIIKKDDEMKGYFDGQPIEALCGKKWIPTRDPKRYPICEECKAVHARIVLSGSN